MKMFEPKNLEVENFVPWADSKNWKQGFAYPLPHSEEATFELEQTDVFILSGAWGVYMLDPSIDIGNPLYGDCIPIVAGLTMFQSFEISNSHNDRELFNQSKKEKKDATT